MELVNQVSRFMQLILSKESALPSGAEDRSTEDRMQSGCLVSGGGMMSLAEHVIGVWGSQ